MLYSYDSSTKKNSTLQILNGTIKEVQEDAVVVNVPLGYNKSKDYTITKESLSAYGNLEVGKPISAIGTEDGNVFEVDEKEQRKLSGKSAQFYEFTRYKENQTTKTKNPELSAFFVFALSKSTQVKINEEKKTVLIPVNVENKTVWLTFSDKGKFNHYDNYQAEGKDRLGFKAYAEMLIKKLNDLKEDELLMVSYASRFAGWDKENQKEVPLQPTEDKGRLVYNAFANGETVLGLMLNTSMPVAKTYFPLTKTGQPVQTQETPTQAPNEATQPEENVTLDEDNEAELLAAMGV